MDKRPWYKRFILNFILSIPDESLPPSKFSKFVDFFWKNSLALTLAAFFIAGILLLFSGEIIGGIFTLVIVSLGLYWLRSKSDENNMNKEKTNLIIISILSIAMIISVIIISPFSFFEKESDLNTKEDKTKGIASTESIKKEIEANDSVIVTDSETQKDDISEVLSILYIMYHVSLDNTQEADTVNLFIYEELKEAMDDVNKLESLQYRIDDLKQSEDEIVSTVGLGLSAVSIGLINTRNEWIGYLRTIDDSNIDMSEYQYQHALLLSNTKDLHMLLAESLPIFQMIVVDFAEDEGGENRVFVEIKDHFISEIDRLFTDSFAADDLLYQQTKTRSAIIFLVRGYRDFLTSLTNF